MKKPKNQIKTHSPKQAALIFTGLSLISAIAIGIVFGYNSLRNIYLEQCVITDLNRQVEINHGKMVDGEVIREKLGLKTGANLALIDFKTKREDALKTTPNIRNISISRHLPDRITVDVEERSPIARVNIRGKKAVSGKVVDTDGVVFIWQRGTNMLPTIREADAPGTHPGAHLSGRALAALRVIEACQEGDLRELGILEIDASKNDYLLATLGNYSRAKIAWNQMNDIDSFESRDSMLKQLEFLTKAVRSHISDDQSVIWNATDTSGKIYADIKGAVL